VGRPAKYPDQFRREAVTLVESSGRPIAEVARSLGINESTLWNWVKQNRTSSTPSADPDDVVRKAEAFAAVGVSTIMASPMGVDPRRWLQERVAPAIPRLAAIEPRSV
jgi:transposase